MLHHGPLLDGGFDERRDRALLSDNGGKWILRVGHRAASHDQQGREEGRTPCAKELEATVEAQPTRAAVFRKVLRLVSIISSRAWA